MTFQVILADRAALELEDAARWWADHRSTEQAERWHSGFIEALNSLEASPERCAAAREDGRFPIEIRQINYGVGPRPTHRAVFTVLGNSVIVLAIRHLARQDLTPDELR